MDRLGTFHDNRVLNVRRAIEIAFSNPTSNPSNRPPNSRRVTELIGSDRIDDYPQQVYK